MKAPILVTGVTGFIAKHVALRLLQEGYSVRGTARSLRRAEMVRETFARHGADVGRFTVVEADLGSEKGWREAAAGCSHVQHIASPLPMRQPNNREALVPHAREGTLRVLKCAREAGAERVVITSSIVTMMYRADRTRTFTFGEADWTDPETPHLSAYMVSKTRAEQAAWDWCREHASPGFVTTVHPGLVLGPPLDAATGASLNLVLYMLKGAYPAVPRADFPIVDVRDVAEVHVRAMTTPPAGGRRLISAGETLSLRTMAGILRDAFPSHARKIPTRTLPDTFVKLMAVFDAKIRAIVPDLGYHPRADSAYVAELLGTANRSADEALKSAGRAMIDLELV